ncbi:unnamed protein product [Lymnaea stagnalis]|uniref:Uncharacterized protein n=1 Tax=Lymnaea stagnalis TaxID=6523 RepID=A0AAV2HN61_LYMST
MSSKYDEDVCDNPIFCKISSEFAEYITKLIASKGILCVPKFSIAASISLSKQDVEDHILLPTKDVVDDNDDFKTCSGKACSN